MNLVDGYDHRIQFCRSKHVERNYRINPIVEILKLPYLNLNTRKEIQIFWTVVLLDRVL
jgi:hypothetical protein